MAPTFVVLDGTSAPANEAMLDVRSGLYAFPGFRLVQIVYLADSLSELEACWRMALKRLSTASLRSRVRWLSNGHHEALYNPSGTRNDGNSRTLQKREPLEASAYSTIEKRHTCHTRQ